MQLCERFDRSKVMQLMKRRQGRQSLESFNHAWVHHDGCCVDGAAVNDAMPGAGQAMISEVAFEPTQQKTDCIFMGCSCLEPLICDLMTDRIHRHKTRLVANPINLAVAQNHAAPELASGRKECEFDTGRPGIDCQNHFAQAFLDWWCVNLRHDVKARINVFDIPSKRCCGITHQKRRYISDILNAHELMLGRASASPLQ